MMINKRVVFLTITAITLAGCGGGNETKAATSVVLPNSYTTSDGRLLGSVGCTQCHGTNGVSNTSWDSIAGEGEFASENFRKHPIMQTVADGYNNNEKRVIDSWLNSMPEHENNNDD